MTQKEKFEPAGFVHKFFGEQIPGGFYWVLVDAKYNGNQPPDWAATPESWRVCIIVQSLMLIALASSKKPCTCFCVAAV